MNDVQTKSQPGTGDLFSRSRLLHTMIRVLDLEKSIDFYTRLLGMKLLRRKDFPTGEFTLAFVGYSGGISGAIRAIEHIAHIFIEAESVPLRNTDDLPQIQTVYDESGEPRAPMPRAALSVLLDDLAWWSAALGKARAEGELAPGSFRVRAAVEAAQAAHATA